MYKTTYCSPETENLNLCTEQSLLASSPFDANNYTENFLNGGEEDL